jgi:hypothetical protein
MAVIVLRTHAKWSGRKPEKLFRFASGFFGIPKPTVSFLRSDGLRAVARLVHHLQESLVKTSITLGGLLLGSVAILLGQFEASAVPGDGGTASVGPDVIVGSIPDFASYGSATVNGVVIRAYAFGTTSCNIGTVNLDWYASPNNQHPFIPMNMYR